MRAILISLSLLLASLPLWGSCRYDPISRKLDCSLITAVGSLSCSLGTCYVYDDTPTTGSTLFYVRAGAGQSGNLQEWRNAAGTALAGVSAAGKVLIPSGNATAPALASIGKPNSGINIDPTWGDITLIVDGSEKLGVNSGGVVSVTGLAISTGMAGWDDAKLYRADAGRLQINSGTAGKWAALDVGSISLKSLATPGTPTVTPTCVSDCTHTWGIKIVALDGSGNVTAAGAEGTTAVGAATLNASNYNDYSWAAVTGATSYDVYLTTSGGTPATLGKIANVTTNAYRHEGANGDAGTAPANNTTGTVASIQWIQFASDSEPTCNAGNRGKLVMVQGGAGVADTFRICAKNAADAYAWTALY